MWTGNSGRDFAVRPEKQGGVPELSKATREMQCQEGMR